MPPRYEEIDKEKFEQRILSNTPKESDRFRGNELDYINRFDIFRQTDYMFEIYRTNPTIKVYKLFDELFLVLCSGNRYYECDQFKGLKECLRNILV